MNFAKERVARCPSSWERKRIKHHISRFFGGGTPAKDNVKFWVDGTIPWVSSKDMKVARLTDTEDYITEAALAGSSTSMVQPGSVIIVVRSGILKHSIPVAINDVPVALNQDLKAIELRRSLDRRFFQYWVTGQQKDLLLEWRQLGATVDSIDIDTLRNTVIPLPDLDTQKAVADFLDHETARIDALVEKKRAILKIANERLSTSLEDLTFGNASFMGTLTPLKWVCRITEGQVDPRSEAWKDKPLIAPNHIEKGTGRLSSVESADEQGAISGKYAFPAGTILYSKIRPALMKACIAPTAGLCSADMYPILPGSKLLPDFLLMQLLSKSFTDWAALESMRVAMPKINRERLGSVRLVVPPISKQREAAEEFARIRTRIDRFVDLTEKSISALHELRASLITAAVTGQIDPATYRRHGTTDRALEKIEAEMAP